MILRRFIESKPEEERQLMKTHHIETGAIVFLIVACSRWTKSVKKTVRFGENVFSHFFKSVWKTRALDAIHPITTHDDAVLLANADGESRSRPLENKAQQS